MTREEARIMVFDLLDAARSYDRATYSDARYYREDYEKLRDKVIDTLCADQRPFHGAKCPTYPDCNGGCGCGCTKEIERARAVR